MLKQFAAHWSLNDIMPNLKIPCSLAADRTAPRHNLVSLMDFVYKACGVLGSVCSQITTDFAKAFEATDHTVAVHLVACSILNESEKTHADRAE